MPIEWNDQSETPSDLQGTSGFSVDVLVYSKRLDVHTVGWYDYNQHKWHFLCNEQDIVKFKWRNFIPEIDKY